MGIGMPRCGVLYRVDMIHPMGLGAAAVMGGFLANGKVHGSWRHYSWGCGLGLMSQNLPLSNAEGGGGAKFSGNPVVTKPRTQYAACRYFYIPWAPRGDLLGVPFAGGYLPRTDNNAQMLAAKLGGCEATESSSGLLPRVSPRLSEDARRRFCA